MTLRYTPEAIQDLQKLKAYISQVLRNPIAATRVIKKILDTCALLESHPHLGRALEDHHDLRCLFCQNHIAFYRLEGQFISVARILDARHDYLRILFPEDV